MPEQERNKQNQDQEIRHNLFVSPKEEVHSKIDIESGQDVEPSVDTETNGEASTPRHPDVKAEKNAAPLQIKVREEWLQQRGDGIVSGVGAFDRWGRGYLLPALYERTILANGDYNDFTRKKEHWGDLYVQKKPWGQRMRGNQVVE